MPQRHTQGVQGLGRHLGRGLHAMSGLERAEGKGVCARNHPSGVAKPSAPDRSFTRKLNEALRLVGVRILDHIVVGVGSCVSMAERGLL